MLKRAILAALSSGLQFENLIVNHAMELVPCLHLGDLDGEIAGDGFFDALIPAESLL